MAPDKKKHMLGGALIACAVWFITYRMGSDVAPALGIIAAIVIGILKEWPWDRYMGGTVDPMDAAATFVGGAVAVVGLKLIYVLYLGW